MSGYKLERDEVIIMQSSNIMHGGFMASYTDEIILTNMNFVYISKGLFGNVKQVMKYPLGSIKVFRGVAQATVGKAQNGTEALQIYFQQSEEVYCFQSNCKKETVKWVNAINQVITGKPSPYVQLEEEEGLLAGTIKETVGAFKEAFGIKKEPKNSILDLPPIHDSNVKTEPENVTKKCIGCMAPLTGRKGSYIKCRYCDTKQTL